MSAGLLVRVGIDGESGKWNAPCDLSGSFCYVPMGYNPLTIDFDPLYLPYQTAVERFLDQHKTERIPQLCKWPSKMPEIGHFDPDFRELTYGDQGRKADRIQELVAEGDFLVFYAGLRGIETGNLTYSIIGFYEIRDVLPGQKVPQQDRHRNEHTRSGRRMDPSNSCVVFARAGTSGRLTHHIPIGEKRGKHYRVTKELIDAWGDLDVKDGFIHRSGHIPKFLAPQRFRRWFERQSPKLVEVDNPGDERSFPQVPSHHTDIGVPDFLMHDDDGYIHVTGHRIGLGDIVFFYRQGDSPEMLHARFPTISLPVFYKVIAYYLENQPAVDEYCCREREELIRQRANAPSGPSLDELRERRESGGVTR